MFHVLPLHVMQEAPIRPVVFSDMSSARPGGLLKMLTVEGMCQQVRPCPPHALQVFSARPRRRALRPQEKMPQILRSSSLSFVASERGPRGAPERSRHGGNRWRKKDATCS